MSIGCWVLQFPTACSTAVQPSISCFRPERAWRSTFPPTSMGWPSVFPSHFNKAPEQSESLEIDLRISDALSIDATYSNNLSLSIAQDAENAWRALASIGEVRSELTLDDVDANTTIISGRLEELDISAWADTQARFRSGGNPGLPAIVWRDFSVDRLALGETDFGAFSSTGQYEGGLTSLGLVGDFIKAQIDFDGPEAQLNIQIDSLSLDSLPTINIATLGCRVGQPSCGCLAGDADCC